MSDTVIESKKSTDKAVLSRVHFDSTAPLLEDPGKKWKQRGWCRD